MNHRTDPEDVVQAAVGSFFVTSVTAASEVDFTNAESEPRHVVVDAPCRVVKQGVDSIELMHILQRISVCLLAVAGVATTGSAGDWPMWRYDAARGNATPDAIPSELHLQWVRQLPPPQPAWPASQTQLQFDAVYQPIVTAKQMVVGCTVSDSITAYDTESGQEIWRFYTEGPVRFAPVAHDGQIYVVSDDGYLYCLDADSGKLIWKVNGGPTDRRIIGNGRIVSSWPARGGPVVAHGGVYFATGIWPFMGIFVHAVDAESGRTVWINSETGSLWTTHPHGAPSFGSVVPQGYLAVAGDNVVVPGGRSLPAVFDRKTGRLRHFQFGGSGAGVWSVAVHEKFYVVGGAAYAMQDGAPLSPMSADVLTDQIVINGMTCQSLVDSLNEVESKDRRGKDSKKVRFSPKESWTLSEGEWRVFAMAGHRAYAGGDGKVVSLDMRAARSSKKAQAPEWLAEVDGRVESILAADDKLFVVTGDAKIYCFGGTKDRAKVYSLNIQPLKQQTDRWSKRAHAMLAYHGTSEGYAVAIGIGSGRLIDQVVASSKLHVIVIDPDAKAVERFRRRLDAAGMYGLRVSAHVGSLTTLNLPPYLANLIFAEDLSETDVDGAGDLVPAMFKLLRPYGGVACIALSDVQHAAYAETVREAGLETANLTRIDSLTSLRRVGPLPGSGSWTHQYADSANSVVSKDALVKAPLGVLWYGGPPNDNILPRHGHGPSPQVAGGRLVIEGLDLLRCVDVYTGRVIWEKTLPGLGNYYNVTHHFPGAGEIGSNYITLPDAVYVVYGDTIFQLDAANGETIREFKLKSDAENSQPNWGFLAASGELLVATSTPVEVAVRTSDDKQKTPPDPNDQTPPVKISLARQDLADALSPTRYASASRRLVAFHRPTGQRLWERTANLNFRHNCIVLAAGKVFCVDSMTSQKVQALKRYGVTASEKSRLLALDEQTGKEIWSTDKDVFGTFLNYSVEHDILVQAGSSYRDRAGDEVGQGIIAYRGSDGQVLWKNLSLGYGGPCLLWRDKIITNGGGGFAIDLATGQPTGWKYSRMYGCNTAVGSQHLLTFRSGAAGFCDLSGDSGTGNIGGFRSSCTSNLIVADGVLNAPDYTRTCGCAYQNQCSLALVHMPKAEMWTFSSLQSAPEQIGINLGAPGDRRGPDGTLWYEFPSVGGNSPSLPITIHGEQLRSVRHHSSRISEGGDGYLPWVATSCVVGVASIKHKSPVGENKTETPYTVRLHFAELEDLRPGERVFDVLVNGMPMLTNFDIARETGGPLRGIVKELNGIKTDSEITLTFTSKKGQPCISGVEVHYQ